MTLLIVMGLIVCGSLYPWHFAATGVNPWLVLLGSWPSQWTVFTMRDASLNVLIYVPLGMPAFLAVARRQSPRVAAWAAISTGLALSFGMELLQVYVPGRDPSLFDVACNTTGACAGTLVGWRFRKIDRRAGEGALPPVLLLGCWACYHLYPFVPKIAFERMRIEAMFWLHPPSFSLVETWSYGAEWIAAGVAAQWIFGRVRPWWIGMAVAFHFAVRPLFASRPLMIEELLGLGLAFMLWKILPEAVLSSAWLLISVVVLREFAPLHSPGGFSWIPFEEALAVRAGSDVIVLSRAMFDYAAILWLWRRRGVSYEKGGAILVAGLAGIAVVQRYLLPGGALSMTDPALALLAAIVFGLEGEGGHRTGEGPRSRRGQ